MTFDVTNTGGTFEIDTCCTTPNSHLVYADDIGGIHSMDFTKGVVQIGVPCNSIPFTDVNCDGITDVFDVVLEVDVAFRSVPDPGPCCFSAP